MKLYFSVILKNIQALVDPRKFPFALMEFIRYIKDMNGFFTLEEPRTEKDAPH